MATGLSSGWTVDAGHRLGPGVRQRVSTHCDTRPDAEDIELVVIHNISLPPGEFGGPWIEALFMGRIDHAAHPYFESLRGLRVSAHLLVDRHGGLTQFVPFDQRAWHAGISSWRGRERCNDFSVGIELEGSDDQAFASAQYNALAAALKALFARYPRLGPDRLVGHSDIAPGRKTDPGPCFDWARLLRLLDPIPELP
ncbi:1,6-anhydro-N-acetylmuramyl-L-alanine amidase AmpD [Panacagrimonas sp.]|uniref:1,6-anhydro-N-acetylmuramyl-L-alanine amidase AmpD n=1 Tax=Panacagrimonas sp. TaxID=2480088 RepID=UPI003B52A10C